MTMDSAVLYIVLALMLAAGVLTVTTGKLLTAVIYAGVLSTLAALGYLLLGAPDVALAEVVVGATLATVIFLVTLKKYRIFTIYTQEPAQTSTIACVAAQTLREQDLDPHILHTSEAVSSLLTRPDCDLVIEPCAHQIILHGEANSQYVRSILAALRAQGHTVILEDSLLQRITHYREGGAK